MCCFGGTTLYRILLCLALVAPLTLSIAPPQGNAQTNDAGFIVPRGSQGLEFGQVIDDNGNVRFTDETAARFVQAGATWIHINFRLGGFQDWQETDTFGYSALDLYDEVVSTAERHGLEIVGLLSNEAWRGGLDNWQAGSAEAAGGVGENGYLRAFATEAAVPLATRFAGRVNYWEIWNEPNAAETYLYPSNFAWLLARVYTEVKAAGITSARFISGGLSSKQSAGGFATGDSTGADYLAATYAAGKTHAGWEEIRAAYGSYPLDAIGQHIYVDGYRQTDRAMVRAALDLVRAAYVAGEGSGEKQTIVTEMGWASGNVSERVQADNLQLAFAEILNTPYVQTASWFFLRDEPLAGLGFGLLRFDGSEKPAWRGYRVITIPEAPPVEPFGVLATGFPTTIQLKWHANAAPDLAGYRIYRSSKRDGPYELLIPELLTAPVYTDVGLPVDLPIFYRITAVDTDGNESGISTTAGAMTGDTLTLESFAATWERTDAPVATEQVQRTWIWGAEPLTQVITERYDDAPDGFRQVQYYDKSRMELADAEGDEEESTWQVTNGLLVWELMTGWLQAGDATYIESKPAAVNIAGDPDTGPTYAALSPLRWADEMEEGDVIISRVDAEGAVTEDPGLAEREVTAAHFVEETGHTIAEPFWEFMNAEGPIDDAGVMADGPLFENPFYATGFPLTEAYWAEVEVDGVPVDVLIQCFQRRCLTYTPDNPEGWQVEAGNVGWHYYQWRYGEE